jgi:hypothetical protein
MTKQPTPDVSHCVRTLRLKAKAEGYAWLNGAAAERQAKRLHRTAESWAM